MKTTMKTRKFVPRHATWVGPHGTFVASLNRMEDRPDAPPDPLER